MSTAYTYSVLQIMGDSFNYAGFADLCDPIALRITVTGADRHERGAL